VIVIDTSAILAILNYEPERTAFFETIWGADRRLVSAVTYQEAGHVLMARRGVNGLYDLEDFMALICEPGGPFTTGAINRQLKRIAGLEGGWAIAPVHGQRPGSSLASIAILNFESYQSAPLSL
jgi:predicted nucleic acid-binding protein